MSLRFLSAVVIFLACVTAGCRDSTLSTATRPSGALPVSTTVSTQPVTSTPAAVNEPDSPAPGPAAVIDDAVEECESFTIGLDRLVFVRLQPLVERATDLLYLPPDTDPAEVAAGLEAAGAQVFDLVEDLDLMGVPPIRIVELVLSIREGALRYAEGFEQGARGWASGDAELISQARQVVQEATAVMTGFFGWRLCGEEPGPGREG